MRLIESEESISESVSVSAVFLVAITQDSILAVRNERGWELLGGHVEIGESPGIALARETLEEAGAVFPWAEPFGILRLRNLCEMMLFYVTNSFDLVSFFPTDDALERGVMPLDEFRNRYCSTTAILEWLVEGTRARIARHR
jgi:ADP-ribose pyrophosphatase YjhB (NUDIX family)